MTVPCPGEIGELGHWATERPLDAIVKDHVHGAVDIVAEIGTTIVAPEAGFLYGFALTIPEGRPRRFEKVLSFDFPFRAHAHDLYGAILALRCPVGRTHLFAHLFMKQILKYSGFFRDAWDYEEEEAEVRWPSFLWHTFGSGRFVKEGERIGVVGNAGYSKGSHVHWEIHNGWTDTPYGERPDPEKLLKGE